MTTRLGVPVATKTSTFSLSAREPLIVIDAAGSIDCDLPDPASVVNVSWEIVIINPRACYVTLDRQGSGENIQGIAANFVLSGAYTRWTVYCDGTDWFVGTAVENQFRRFGHHFADFFNVISSTEGYQATVSGSGASVTNPSSPPISPHFGVVVLTTGTTAAGRAGISSTRGIGRGSDGPFIFESRILIATLADAGEDYELVLGYLNTTTSPDPSVGVWFAYDRVGVGGNWRARTNRTAGPTDTDTGVAVAAGVWTKFQVVWDQPSAEAKFYIDGVLVATNVADLPLAGDGVTPALAIYKSVGTTAREFYVDYVSNTSMMNATLGRS